MVVLQIKPDSNNHTLIVDVAADNDQWNNVLKRLVNTYSKSVKTKGFRSGHIPYNVALQNIKKTNAYVDGIREICNISYNELIESNKIDNCNIIQDMPQTAILKVNDNEVEIRFTFDLVPNVVLGDYERVLNNYIKPSISELEIDNQITMLTNKLSILNKQQVSKVVLNNSLVKIDFEGTIDGKTFPGSKALGYNIQIGSHEFLPGFEEKLIGLKVGDETTFKLTIPSDYYLQDLQNKEVTYKVKIKEIISNSYFELNDETVKQLKLKNVNNLKQLRETLKNQILAEKSKMQFEQVTQKLLNILTNETKIEFLPTSLVNQQKNILLAQYKQYAESKKTSLENFVKKDYELKTMDNFYKFIDEKAINNVKLMFAVDYLLDKYKIEITDDERKNVLNSLCKKHNLSIEDFKQKFNYEYELKIMEFTQSKLFKKLININTDNEFKK